MKLTFFYIKEESKQKPNSIVDALPGNSIVAKAGYLTGATGLATFLISKEIYILNEETLVLIATTGLLGVLLKYLREPFTNMADEHIAVSSWEKGRKREAIHVDIFFTCQ